jgi:DNA-binding SARP family transcriptional activator
LIFQSKENTVLRFEFLGSPQLWRDQQQVHIRRAKALALLVYLAITRTNQPRERILALLWPESSAQAARKNLRNTLWELGELFGDEAISQQGQLLQLHHSVAVDIYRLEDGLLLLETGAVAALEACVQAYRGPLADGLLVNEAADFELWLDAERERLAALYQRLLERIIELHQHAQQWQAVISSAQTLIASDPFREGAYLAQIEAYIKLGQRAQAVQLYRQLSELLDRELAVTPLPETTRAYQALLAETSVPERPTQPSVALVNRDAELSLLNQQLERMCQGQTGMLLLGGELGIGKTALWQAWAQQLPPDIHLLSSHALASEEPLAFGPLLTLLRQDAVQQRLVQADPGSDRHWLSDLQHLLPELGNLLPDLPQHRHSITNQRQHLFQALHQAIRLLLAPRGVLVIDDLHWADNASLDLLSYIFDQSHATPLLLVLCFDTRIVSPRLQQQLAHWQLRGAVQQILAPLSEKQAFAVLAQQHVQATHQQQADWVRQSGGNPLFLLQLSQSYNQQAPQTLVSLIRAQVQTTISPADLQIAQALAVLGQQSEFSAIWQSAGRSEEQTIDALDRLVAAGLIEYHHEQYRFRHPIVGSVIMGDLSPARRQFLQQRAKQTRQQAHNHAQLQPPDAQAAVDLAGQSVAWRTIQQRQLVLAEALLQAGQLQTAQKQLLAVYTVFRQNKDNLGQARALLLLANISVLQHQSDTTNQWLQQLENLDLPDEIRAQALLYQAASFRHAQQFALAEQSLAQAQQFLDANRSIAGAWWFERGNLLANQGDLLAALAAFEQSLGIAQATGDLTQEAMAHNNLAYHALLAGQFERAEDHLLQAEDLVKRYEIGYLWQFVGSTKGEIALERGKLAQAKDAFREAYTAAKAWHNQQQQANILLSQAQIAQQEGQVKQAKQYVQQAHKLAAEIDNPQLTQKFRLFP